MEELIENMKKMSGEELYLKALEYKEKKNYCTYRMYLTMSANYGYEKGIQEHEYPDDIMYTEQYQKTDFSEFLKFCELTRNELFSMTDLGNIYKMGKYLPQNREKALELYIESYEKGNKYVVNNIGYEYQTVLKNHEKAVAFYEIGVSFGCRDSMNNLGYMYLHGCWVQRNYEKAFELLTIAKSKGNYYPNFHLGFMYKNVLHVKKDYEKAIELFEEAVSKGLERGFKYLSDTYKEYKNGKGDKKYVHEYFLKFGKGEYLRNIYGYSKEFVELLSKNYELERENLSLRQENEEMKNHINASPEGPLYFEAMKQWKLDSQSNTSNSPEARTSPSTRV